MTYARARLWLGITGVGLLVLVSAAGLWFDLPDRILHGRSDWSVLALTLTAYVLISIPSDLLGGFILPRHHGRSSVTFGRFLLGWLRGVLVQSTILLLSALTIVSAARRAGPLAGVAIFFFLEIALLIAQLPLAGLVARLKPTGADLSPLLEPELPGARSIDELTSADPGFCGGITGLPGAERLILPALWRKTLPPEVFATELLRRQSVLRTGSRTRGLLVAGAFNLVGFILASHCPDASLTDGPGMVTTSLWFTLWSFAGLLTLPSFSRPAVFAADASAANLLPLGTVEATIRTLDRLQDDEPARTPWVERIFHPIPSVSARLAALTPPGSATEHTPPATTSGAWQTARMSLYLSWAGMSLLSRAVHCNAGRPDLWVLYPSD